MNGLPPGYYRRLYQGKHLLTTGELTLAAQHLHSLKRGDPERGVLKWLLGDRREPLYSAKEIEKVKAGIDALNQVMQ